jgi:alpha-1,6-mannosyl-glycoprotein beta-1,2-N-acetylglucosaminyltransferase
MANVSTGGGSGGSKHSGSTAESEAAAQAQFLNVIPPHLHKFLIPKNGTNVNSNANNTEQLNITYIKRGIEQYNKYQVVLNEDIFGPLHNDSLVIAVQVSIFYLY